MISFALGVAVGVAAYHFSPAVWENFKTFLGRYF